MTTLLKGGTIYSGGQFIRRDILISSGVISLISDNTNDISSAVVHDCGGKFIFPGFADAHVHLREPGFSYKEEFSTGALAAAHGGFCSVCAMPNLNPAPDCRELLKKQYESAAHTPVRIFHYGTITKGRAGKEIMPMEECADLAVAFSDDGSGIQTEDVMISAMERAKKLNKIIAAHCEDMTLRNGGQVHDGEFAKAHNIKGIPSSSEYAQIERDLYLAKKTGCAYHVCHISCKESADLIRKAKKDGVDVTCETAPHYIYFNDGDLIDDGKFKMNPPIRTKADQNALLEGLADGTIDMISTDHAPHSLEEKTRGIEKSLMGIPGLESSFSVCYTALVKSGVLSLEKLISLMSENPSRRFNLPGRDGIKVGAVADLTICDLDEEYIFDAKNTFTKCKITPFDGLKLCGKVCHTIVNGETAWKENQK